MSYVLQKFRESRLSCVSSLTLEPHVLRSDLVQPTTSTSELMIRVLNAQASSLDGLDKAEHRQLQRRATSQLCCQILNCTEADARL